MKKEIEAFVNAANEQELEAAWNNLSALSRKQREAEKQRQFELKQQKRKEKHRGR